MGELEPIQIAIIGGGIGGLALSIGLQKYSHIQVKIYEAASKFEEIGGEMNNVFTSPPITDPQQRVFSSARTQYVP